MPLLHLTRKDMRPDFTLMKRLLGQGLPMAFQLSITSIGAIILQMAVNSLGSDAVAAITVGGKIQIFVFLLLSSFGLTMATFCSQNLGAGKIRRVSQGVHTCMIVSLICSVVGGVMIYFFGHHIALLFINAEEIAVLSAVKQFLRIGTFFYPVLAVMFLLRNSIQGLGYSTLAMIAGIFEMVTRAGIALGFVYRIGFDAACFAQPVSWLGAVCFLLPAYYLILHRLKKRYPSLG